jgi:cysteine synthase A
VLAGQPITDPNHRIQGGGYSLSDLSYIEPHMVDGYLQVTDDDAIANARRLAREEGIFAGFSSGANVAAALQLLDGPCKGMSIAILICDSGLKYLSTDLWE